MSVEEKIKNYFNDHYLYMTPYAEKAGIKQSRFSRIVNGKSKISAEEFYRLSKALNVTMDELMNYGEEA